MPIYLWWAKWKDTDCLTHKWIKWIYVESCRVIHIWYISRWWTDHLLLHLFHQYGGYKCLEECQCQMGSNGVTFVPRGTHVIVTWLAMMARGRHVCITSISRVCHVSVACVSVSVSHDCSSWADCFTVYGGTDSNNRLQSYESAAERGCALTALLMSVVTGPDNYYWQHEINE